MRHRLRTMTPGRVEPPETVRRAAEAHGTDVPVPAAGILDGLRELAGTGGPVLPLTMDEEAAWDAVLGGLLEPGARVLTVEGGPCGRRLTAAGARSGLDMSAVGAPAGRSLDAEVLDRALASDTSFRAVLLPAVEAATGAAQPLAELAGIASSRDVLMLVDGGHVLGVSALDMDASGLDAVVAAGRKGLMQSRGMTAVALSQRAWQGLEASGVPALLEARRRCLDGALPKGLNGAMAGALHAAVADLASQGTEAVFARNAALAASFRTAVLALGLDTVSRGPHACALSAVRLPAGVSAELLAMAMAEEYGVLVSAPADLASNADKSLAGRVLTVAHCAPLDYADVLAAVAALRACLPLVGGHSACPDALEQAMAAYEHSLYGSRA